MTTQNNNSRKSDLRDPGLPIKIDKSGSGTYPNTARYKIFTGMDVDLYTGETRSNLLGITPINIDFDPNDSSTQTPTLDLDTPPPVRKLSTSNLDIDVAGRIPEITKKQQRQLVIDNRGATYREPRDRYRRSTGRGNRDVRNRGG